MSHDELVEQFAREHRYRGVLVVAAVVGIIASAVVGIAFSLGGIELSSVNGTHEGGALALLVVPFAASMVVGSGIYKALLFNGRHRRRR